MGERWLRKFAVIWTGQFISLVSSSAVNFAIIIWLSMETRSAEVLSYAAIAGLLPQALVGVVAGIYVDRWNKKLTMILSDATVAIFTLGLSLTFYLGSGNLALVYAVLALRSLGSAFHMPAMQATTPLLAPKSELVRVSGINQLLQSITVIAGPALGALLIGYFRIEYVLLLDVAGAAVAITALLLVDIPSVQNRKQNINGKGALKLLISDFRAGINAIKNVKGLRSLFAVSLGATFFMIPIGPLLPLITLEHFGGDKFEIGLVEIIWGVGMLLGSVLVTILKPQRRKVMGINLTNVIAGSLLAGAGLLSGSYFIVFALFVGLCGITYSIESALFNTVVQENIEQHSLGRVFSMYYSIIVLPSIGGLLLTGFLSDSFGISRIFFIFGTVVMLIGVFSFFIPSLKTLEFREEHKLE